MIVLEHEGALMEIAELGAEMRRFRSKDGVERIWCGDPAVWKSTAPVLFPTINLLKDGVVTIDGVECAVPKHGFAKYQLFEVTDQGDDYVTLTLSENAETKAVYPFDFALSVTHRFTEGGFETRYVVENHTGRKMPFVIGGHPGFTCPMAEGEQFTDYVLRFAKEEEGRHLLNTPEHYMGEEAVVDLGEDHRTLTLRYEDFDRPGHLYHHAGGLRLHPAGAGGHGALSRQVGSAGGAGWLWGPQPQRGADPQGAWPRHPGGFPGDGGAGRLDQSRQACALPVH